MPLRQKKIFIIGGGAAGFFLAANLPHHPAYQVVILEKTAQTLQKVKISGGGRCNLTHAEFNPKLLALHYPRGHKELLSVFSKFQPSDTFEWFQKRGLELIIEEDFRVFPQTQQSQSVIDLFHSECRKNQTEIKLQENILSIKKVKEQFLIETSTQLHQADFLVICSGSSPSFWSLIERDWGLALIPPVPSLFTFNCSHPLLQDLQGTTFAEAEAHIPSFHLSESGSVLITHWGLSGPAILKLSAFGARELAQCNYSFDLVMNWLGISKTETYKQLQEFKKNSPSLSVAQPLIFPALTKRFWHRVLFLSGIPLTLNWAELSNEKLETVAELLSECLIKVSGKSIYKEEFVTAGGVDLKEINFKNMESKRVENLYFAGEVLNIDALTGGFNFQACWSEAFIISEDLKNKMKI